MKGEVQLPHLRLDATIPRECDEQVALATAIQGSMGASTNTKEHLKCVHVLWDPPIQSSRS